MTEKKTKTDKVADAINTLADAIRSLEAKMEKHFTPVKIEEPTIPADAMVSNATQQISDNLPQEFRKIINERLSEKFGGSVVYRTDGLFEFKVHVPREYSNINKDTWKLNGGDVRLRVIENALGEIGVREWCDKIAENLGHDIMQKVHEQSNSLVA